MDVRKSVGFNGKRIEKANHMLRQLVGYDGPWQLSIEFNHRANQRMNVVVIKVDSLTRIDVVFDLLDFNLITWETKSTKSFVQISCWLEM